MVSELTPGDLVQWTNTWGQIRIGFTSRHGGVSDGEFDSLNLGFHVSDDDAAVASNRDALERELGVPCVWMVQVHGTHVARAGDSRIGTRGYLGVGEADAIVVENRDVPEGQAGLAAAVMVADCVPLVIADRTGARGAVVHVGRAGMDGDIASKAVAALAELGSDPAHLTAVLGPSICGSCYEVPESLADDVDARWPGAKAQTPWGTTSIDIPTVLKGQLERAGVGEVVDLGECTLENEDLFSHRRATAGGHKAGRFVGIIQVLR